MRLFLRFFEIFDEGAGDGAFFGPLDRLDPVSNADFAISWGSSP
jgi:hypothetical protein